MGSATSKIERSLKKRGVNVVGKERIRPSSSSTRQPLSAEIQDLLDQGYEVKYLGQIHTPTHQQKSKEKKHQTQIVPPKKRWAKPSSRRRFTASDSDTVVEEYCVLEEPRSAHYRVFCRGSPQTRCSDNCEEVHEYVRPQTSRGGSYRQPMSFQEEVQEREDATYREDEEERADGTYVTRTPRG